MAKERFRNKNIRRAINIKLKDERSGTYRLWQSDAYQLIARCSLILKEYSKMKIRITLRQMYYDLVSANAIPNHDTAYKKISTLLTDARYLGFIDWNAIEDRNRPHKMNSEWDNVHDLMQSAIDAYRLPRWSDQDFYLEFFTEKDALSSILQPICERWHVRFNVNKGYSSASIMYELSKRIARKIEEGKEAILIYVGDHDSSGLDMVRDIEKRVVEFLTTGNKRYDHNRFSINHIALTLEQVQELDLPPNPAKLTDPRACWYVNRFGDTSWEVEALRADYLMDIVDRTIQSYIDMDKYNVWLDQEEREKQEMRDFADEYLSDDEGDDS